VSVGWLFAIVLMPPCCALALQPAPPATPWVSPCQARIAVLPVGPTSPPRQEFSLTTATAATPVGATITLSIGFFRSGPLRAIHAPKGWRATKEHCSDRVLPCWVEWSTSQPLPANRVVSGFALTLAPESTLRVHQYSVAVSPKSGGCIAGNVVE